MNTFQSSKNIHTSSYLNPSVDPSPLGFLLISLGGSRAVSSSPPSPLTDWDGIGIVTRREEIVNIVTTHRQRLCELLWIAREECASWEGFDSCPSDKAWDVLRFSGLGKDGAKRTIKIWSMEGLLSTSSSPRSCRLGVLSSRRVHYFRRGRTLNLYQPQSISTDLCILEDVDFMTNDVPDSDPVHVPASLPGVTCDLLLTAVPVYAPHENLFRLIASQLTSKWLLLSKSPSVNIESFISSLHASDKFSEAYRHQLSENMISSEVHGNQVQRLKVRLLNELQVTTPWEPRISRLGTDQSDALYTGVYFLGRPSSIPATPVGLGYPLEGPPLSTTDYTLKAGSMDPIPPSPFSSNSTGYLTSVRSAGEGDKKWREVFVKSGPGVAAEFSILPTIQKHFSPHLIQQLCGYDGAQGIILYDRFHGQSLSDIRLKLNNTRGAKKEVFQSLVSIELVRSRHVVAAQLSTFSTDPEVQAGQDIHRFYYDRLHSNRRMQEFYGGGDASFLQTGGGKSLALDELMASPVVVNGTEYPSLESQFRRAEAILDPAGRHLHKAPTAFGLGDGHGGNLLVTDMSEERLRFIDYEVAGFHHPILDQAKPLYLDGFFGVLYKDILLPGNNAGKYDIQWKVGETGITIDYAIQFSLIDRALAFIKLECVLRPLLDRLAAEGPDEVEASIELLSAALFTNALLTRNFSKLPADVFYLNCAVGMTLMHDIKLAFRSFFGWDGLYAIANDAEDSKGWVTLHQGGPVLDEESLTMLLEGFLNQTVKEGWLEPETVFLRRFEETLQVHRRFSKDKEEGEGAVIRRIGKARELGMKIAPHTCIRESIFAEPRIDHHFLYESVLEEARKPGPTPKRLVDVGCCMGSDIRKLIFDGFEAENVLGIDLEKGYFDLGVMMYNEYSKSPFEFREADVLSKDFCRFNPGLESGFDFVHSANVIHLFEATRQLQFFRIMAFLAKPGGCIWGRQVGLIEDENTEVYRQPSGKGARFTASEFKSLIVEATGWDEEEIGYQSRMVKYTELRDARKDKGWVLQWSIRVPEDKSRAVRRFHLEDAALAN
ncbi:hypothetical protein E1B28_002662 [Marasmius oreades]|uniref:Methyltransferase domain-containing protein n=1 Tax=Marasmius oreades TaxID=181124 RepID=A0A9P7RN40_9AGAR|nr:uncharacterized protein E1B28_002662 [Marasmius oreades]KAG7086729.1 hypothetical protein E1B28_002662 [Marasmius oreades]